MLPVISFRNVYKCFKMTQRRPFLAKEIFNRLTLRTTKDRKVWALKNINLEVQKGECIGVIGPNGSGKSTLLSLAAKTNYPTQGEVEVKGRIGPLLELGAGFHPDLTGYENIFLNASLLGLTKKEVEESLEDIIEFAEIGEYLHAPLHTYSSGMQARLGFAVVAHINAEVILIDETLAVGDKKFHEKCERTIQRFIQGQKTMLVVSHDIGTIKRICNKVIMLEKGEIKAEGEPEEVCSLYEKSMEN